MIVPDQGHSVLFLEDPMKRFFVSMDGKPVPVFFQSSNPDERCAKASIRGDAGQAFSVGFWDGRQKKSKYGAEYELFFGDQSVDASWHFASGLAVNVPADSRQRYKVWKKLNGRPFQFSKIPTTDDDARAITDPFKLSELNSIKLVFRSITKIKKATKKVAKAKQATWKRQDQRRRDKSIANCTWATQWQQPEPGTNARFAHEKSDQGQFGIAPGFGEAPVPAHTATPSRSRTREVGSESEEFSGSESSGDEYAPEEEEKWEDWWTYEPVKDTDFTFIIYIRSSAWFDQYMGPARTNPDAQMPAQMPKDAVEVDGTIYLDSTREEADEDAAATASPSKCNRKLERSVGAASPELKRVRLDSEENASGGDDGFSAIDESEDESDDDTSPQEIARTLAMNPELYRALKLAAKGGSRSVSTAPSEASTVLGLSVPPSTASPASTPFSSPTIVRHTSAYGKERARDETPVASGSGVGAAGAAQAGEEWHGRA